MTLDPAFFRQLLATFGDEVQEHVQAANRHLLALEEGRGDLPVADRWNEIFREVHSLKGAARATNQDQIEALAHRLETLLGQARRDELAADPRLFDLVYKALDCIAGLGQEAAGNPATPVDVPELLAQLESAAAGLFPHPASNAASSVSALPAEPARPEGESQPQPAAKVAPKNAACTEETVRVATAKLDALMAQVGELQVARLGAEQRLADLLELLEQVETWEVGSRLRGLERGLPIASPPQSRTLRNDQEPQNLTLHALAGYLRDLCPKFEADNRRLSQAARSLQDGIRHMRMFPVSGIFETYPRMIRDLARELGKEVRLDVTGGETEVDRSVLEHIKDPLTHLLRNAVDHGIERPEVRHAAGKPAEGTITLSASQQGDNVLVEVADDGAGIDLERLRATAVTQSLVTAEEAQAMSDREALWLIFRSGLSTSAQITDLSGRGVGLDVVRDRIERLRGLIDVESRRRQGTHFTLSLPLTVTTTLCLLVQAAGQTLAVPVTNVTQIVRMSPDTLGYAEGRPVLRFGGRPILLLNLAHTLGLSDARGDQAEVRSRAAQVAGAPGFAIVVGSADKRLAFQVDAVVGAQDLVVKNLPPPFVRVRYLAGVAILGTGEAVFVLSAPDLLKPSTGSWDRLAPPDVIEPVAEKVPATILVTDDSITTRTLERSILETAGYRVRTAGDGIEAWKALQSEGCAPEGLFGLLVSDIVMPGMDGLDLTARIRADARLKHLPVVLVTSLDSREERERGAQAGADAYILKGAFDQDSLLETIRRLI